MSLLVFHKIKIGLWLSSSNHPKNPFWWIYIYIYIYIFNIYSNIQNILVCCYEHSEILLLNCIVLFCYDIYQVLETKEVWSVQRSFRSLDAQIFILYTNQTYLVSFQNVEFGNFYRQIFVFG